MDSIEVRQAATLTIPLGQTSPSQTGLPPHSGTGLSDVIVIIPALNEQQSLPSVLHDLPEVGRVIVVDNGSSDQTARVAAEMGADVVHQPQRGYGAACLKGMSAIEWEGENAPEIIAFIDADYSDHPEELHRILEPLFANRADFVIGSRLLGQRDPGAMPPQSVYGNKLACFLMRMLFGGRYTDLGPFRAIRRDALRKLNMCDENFGWTVEMQIKATWAGLRTCEVPVSYRRRVGVSKISGTVSGTIKAGSKILYLIAKYGLFSR